MTGLLISSSIASSKQIFALKSRLTKHLSAIIQDILQAVAYCRVSTVGQSEDGISLAMQRARISAWCIANGYDLTAVFVETQSGGRIDNRPELKKAVALACELGGILVVFSLSRFSRSVRDTLALSEQLDRAGANLASLSEHLDTSSAVGRMVFKLLSTLAEFERDQGAERTRAALAHLRRSNRRISPKIPYGYTLGPDGKTLIPNCEEQEAIERVLFQRDKGVSLARIAKELEESGLKTRGGGRWFPATVASIIERHNKLVA